MTVTVRKNEFNYWIVAEKYGVLPLRSILLNSDEMKELAKKIKKAGF
jgi:hypothetical protein